MSVVYTENFPLTPYNRNEILRYCGAKTADGQLEELLESCLAEADGKIKNRVCYSEFSVFMDRELLDLEFVKTDSNLLLKQLKDCKKVVLFAATIGIEIDRLIKKYSSISPSRAVVFQAIGAERIEALCDQFEDEIKLKYNKISSRVSAGYGDIPLRVQEEIFKALDCPKNIGLTLTDSLLMFPTKSVTAIIGVRRFL